MASHREQGFVLLSAAVMTVLLAGLVAFAADLAHLQYARQRAQTAADAAAITALHEAERGNTAGMLELARADAERNGVNAQLEINYPPKAGAYASNTSAAEARITDRAPTLLMRMFGARTVTVSARAVAIRGGKGITLGE